MLDFDTKRSHKNEIKVDVHSTLTVVSSTPVKPGQVHKLSVVDQLMATHSLHLVYYYRNNPGGHFDLDGLRMSLSKVLSIYPPVTGRLGRDGNGNWEINCNDAGVRVHKGNVSVTLDEWLKSADGRQERDLTAWENMPHDPTMWSPFRIQINDFVGGGLAIGLSCSHMHADLTFVATLFQAWTMAHRHQPIPHPPSFQGFQLQTTSLITSDLDPKPDALKRHDLNQLKMATATFNFSHSAIEQCLDAIYSHCANATPFDLLAAIFWKCIENSNKSDSEDKHSLSICMDFRKVLSEPLPLGYFGNALHFSNLSVTVEELNADNWLPNLAGLINVNACHINIEKIQSAMEVLESSKCDTTSHGMYGRELTCVSNEHLIDSNSGKSILYETMFEEGERPVHVSCNIGNAQGKGLILVMPSPDGGLARMVIVTLPADQLAKLCSDGIIVNLKPSFTVSGGM